VVHKTNLLFLLEFKKKEQVVKAWIRSLARSYINVDGSFSDAYICYWLLLPSRINTDSL